MISRSFILIAGAILGLAARMAAGSVVLDPAGLDAAAALQAATVLCDTSADGGPGRHSPHAPAADTHLEAALAVSALAQIAPLVPTDVVLPAPRRALAARPALPPQARAPPSLHTGAAQARAPPSLV